MKSKYTATKSDVGVWMSNDYLCESVSRMVAIDAMIALDLDPNDFRIRDRIIKGICKRIDGTLDSVNNITTCQNCQSEVDLECLKNSMEDIIKLLKEENT